MPGPVVEGYDADRGLVFTSWLSPSFSLGTASAQLDSQANRYIAGQSNVFTMNFTTTYNELVDGWDWRGVRTKTHSYSRWEAGKVEMFDIVSDPLEMANLADDASSADIREKMEARLEEFMTERGDRLVPCTEFEDWFDEKRYIVRNAYGPLGDPCSEPDWSLLS